MRAILVTLVLLAASTAYAQTPDVKGFDHSGHAAALQKNGKAVDCVTCHATGKEGKLLAFPDRKHRPCSNSGCHSPWPIPPSKEQAEKLCLVCHRKSDVARQKTAPFYPPFDVNPEHDVPFPHARHAVPGATGKLCAACHPGHGAGGDAGKPMSGSDAHSLCSGCHERGASPSMATCQGCHKLTSTLPPRPAKPPWDSFQVTHKFQHEAHARRVGSEEGKRCSACHESLASAKDGQPIPRPRMETCGKCHDGKAKGPEGRAIFAVTGATCNRCHALPPGTELGPPPASPAVLPKFSHTQHMQRGTDVATCTACHLLDAKWLAQAPGKGKDHAPCADAGCHKPEFFSRTPTICSGCHLDFRAFAPARFQGLRKDSEFGREFSHLAHARGLGDGGQNAFCQRCHQGRFEVQPTAQSHGTCAPCHGADASPRMNECGACHGLGKPNGAMAARDSSYPWYVRAQFKHSDHDNDPRANKPTACLLCHDQVVQASTLAQIGRPKMQQCDACHDGKTSFKTTGFGCSRCHGTPEKK
jgi:c(7)-type cytochrome triheme protein